MKKISKLPWNKIGYIALCVLLGVLSGLFLLVLYQSNIYFFKYPTADAAISAKAMELSTQIFISVIAVAVVIMAVVSFVKRQKKAVNKGIIWLCGILALAGMIFFMVFVKLNGMFDIAFENANLYALYFVITALATALPLYSAIRNLVKIKKAPVTFAKAEKDAKNELTPTKEEAAEPETEQPTA